MLERELIFYWKNNAAMEPNVAVADVGREADPAGRLVWAHPRWHDMGAAREHGLIDVLSAAEVRVVAERAYRGAGLNVEVPQHRRSRETDTDERLRLSVNQKAVNSIHARSAPPCSSTPCKPSSKQAEPK